MATISEAPRFSTITEGPRARATATQLRILYTRYRWALSHVDGKDVLEAACGMGLGLGYLAKRARSVTGIDIDAENCRFAGETYAGRPDVTVLHGDVADLPCPSESIDVVILFEALYYLPDAEEFFREARRVLRPGGSLLISSVNRLWPGFNPSPFSTRYLAPEELVAALAREGFKTSVFVAFPDVGGGAADGLIRAVRRAAVALGLFPKTMKGKEWLKRIFYGRLQTPPREIVDGMAQAASLTPLERAGNVAAYQMFYTLSTLEGAK